MQSIYHLTKEIHEHQQPNDMKQHKGKIKLEGHPSGRPPLWQATPLAGHPSGRPRPLAGHALS